MAGGTVVSIQSDYKALFETFSAGASTAAAAMMPLQKSMEQVGKSLGVVTKGAAATTKSFTPLWGTVKKVAPWLGLAVAVRKVGQEFSAAMKAAIEFDTQLHNVWTLTDNTWAQMEMLRGQIRSLAMEFPVLGSQATAALYQIYSATFYGADAMEILEQGLKGASAGLADVFQVSDMLTTVLNAWGLQATETAHINDLLFTTIKFGKCVTGDTRVLLADGRYKRIDEMEGGERIVSFEGRSFVPMESHWVEMGEKPIVRLGTRLGRSIKTTWNHPYLTESGWKKVSDLAVGDKIAVPTDLPFFGDVHVPEGEAAFLGLWLAEGTGRSKTPEITTTTYGREVAEWAEHFGCQARNKNHNNDKAPTYSISRGIENRFTGKNPAMDFLRGLGLDDCPASKKHIPEEAFTWSESSVAVLLRWLFNGDGWLYDKRGSRTGSGFEVGFVSSSERLVRDVSHLLLRFGIVGTVRRRKSVNAWCWETHRYADVRRFVDRIGIDRKGVGEVVSHTPQHQRAARGIVEYDKIVSIEDIGREKVYDLEVPIHQNFIAEDIVAHNTTMSELSSQFGRLAGVAAPAGAAIHEMTAAIATLTRQGIATDWAITSLRQTMMQILRPSTELAKVILALGYDSGRALIETQGFAEAIGLIGRYADANNLKMENLFTNVRAVTAVLPLATTAAKAYALDLERMSQAAGTAEEAFEKQAEAASFKFDRMKTAWRDFTAAATEGFIGSLASIADYIAGILETIVKARQEADELAVATVMGSASIGEFLRSGGTLPETIYPGTFGGFEKALERLHDKTGLAISDLRALYAGDPLGVGHLRDSAHAAAVEVGGLTEEIQKLRDAEGEASRAAFDVFNLRSLITGADPGLMEQLGEELAALAARNAEISLQHAVDVTADALNLARKNLELSAYEVLGVIAATFSSAGEGFVSKLVEAVGLTEEFKYRLGNALELDPLLEMGVLVRELQDMNAGEMAAEVSALAQAWQAVLDAVGGEDFEDTFGVFFDLLAESQPTVQGLIAEIFKYGKALESSEEIQKAFYEAMEKMVDEGKDIIPVLKAFGKNTEQAIQDTIQWYRALGKSEEEVEEFEKALRGLKEEIQDLTLHEQFDKMAEGLGAVTAETVDWYASLANIQGFFDRIVALSEKYPEAGGVFDEFFAYMEKLVPGLKRAGTIVETFSSRLEKLRAVLTDSAKSAEEKAEAVSGLKTLYREATQAQEDLKDAGLGADSAIQSVITAILGLVGGLEELKSAFQEFLDDLEEPLRPSDALSQAHQIISRATAGTLDIPDLLAAGSSISAIQSALQQGRDIAYQLNQADYAGEFQTALDDLLGVLGKTPEEIQDMLEAGEQATEEAMERMWEDFGRTQANLFLSGDFETILGNFRRLAEQSIGDAEMMERYQALKGGFYGFIENIISSMSALPGMAEETEEAEEALQMFKEALGDAEAEVIDWAHHITGIGQVISSALDALGMPKMAGYVSGAAGAAAAFASGNIYGGIAGVIDTIASIFRDIKEKFQERLEELKQMAQTVWEALKTLADYAWRAASAIWDLAKKSEYYADIQSYLAEMTKWLANILFGFLGPIAAILKELFHVEDEVKKVTKEISKTTARLSNLNVPVGWKYDRIRHWASIPDQPPIFPGAEEDEEKEAEEKVTWVTLLLGQFGLEIEALKAKIISLGQKMEEFWAEVGPGIVEGFLWVINKFVDAVIVATDWIIENKDELAGLIGAIFSAVTPILETFGAAVGGIASFIWSKRDDLVKFFKAFGEWWSTEMDPFLQSEVFVFLREVAEFLWQKLKELVEFLGPKVMPLLRELFSIVKSTWDTAIRPMLEEWAAWVQQNWPTISAFLKNQLQAALDGFVEKLRKGGELAKIKLLDGAGDSAATMDAIFSSESLSFWEKLGVLWMTESTTFWQKLGGTIGSLANEFIKGVVNAIIWVFNALISVVNLIPFVNIPKVPYLETEPGEWWEVAKSGLAVVHEGEKVGRLSMPDLRPAQAEAGVGYDYRRTPIVIINKHYLDGREIHSAVKRRDAQGNIGSGWELAGAY